MDHDTPPTSSGHSSTQHAPWLPIPSRAISAIEHPCIVKNVDKGIASLGGPVRLSKGLRAKIETTTNAEGDDELKKLISVSLRPNDPFAKRLLSTPVRTNNLLVKVTAPKRTGRKRKRGSTDPFLSDQELGIDDTASAGLSTKQNHSPDVPTLLRILQDNPTNYHVSVTGIIDETHRFRSMPDLQYAASHDDLMVDLRDHVLPQRFSRVKTYQVDTAAGKDLTKSIGPSAEFLQMPVAFNYRFQQNTYVKYTDQGVVNLQRSIAYNAYTIIKPTDESVPLGPKSTLPAEDTLTPYLQTLIKQIRAELAQRPIMTRHILYNKLGWDKRTKIRQASVYCGFFFESGPWREALVLWGIDPRKDPEYRKYQTVSFLSYVKSGNPKHKAMLNHMSREELEHEHTFDGVTVSQTGNLFQFCDITDPLIARILATKDIRTTCAPTFQGWYHAGTWAKATVILKDKMNTILANDIPDDAIYQRVIEWPELWDDKDIAAKYKDEINDRQIHQDKKREHDVMHSVRVAARNPRYAFGKMDSPDEDELPTDRDASEGVSELDADGTGVPEDMTENPVTVDAMLGEDSDEGEDENEEEDFHADEDDRGREHEEDEMDEFMDADEDEDDDRLPTANRALSEGPAPFGGLYRM